ncbi:hypothetical protein AMS68_001502 [Peltaster fructicola]|uniref:Ribosomal protein S17 n=1 Tax=Peltaster fructicola TaxID=286661 RepID=A0A6H0XMX3_9PEZI|nr:hypothetical protein AMS68_001502 [Peltaster fructicola]
MKRPLLALSARVLPLRTAQSWTCRRCLAQSAVAPIVIDDFIAPPAVPQQSHDIPTPNTFVRTTADTTAHQAAASTTTSHSSDAAVADPTTKAHPVAQFEALFLDSSLPTAQQERRKQLLTLLRKDIQHDVPSQYLTHVHPGALTNKELEQREQLYKWAMTGHANDKGEPKTDRAREIKGVVVSAGKMDRTVKVRIPEQRWEPRIHKYYASHTDHLVHDPNNSLVEGDIVILHRLSVAKTVRHVIGEVAVPYGKPLAERPPIPTPEERLAEYKKQRLAKFARRAGGKKTTKSPARAAR